MPPLSLRHAVAQPWSARSQMPRLLQLRQHLAALESKPMGWAAYIKSEIQTIFPNSEVVLTLNYRARFGDT